MYDLESMLKMQFIKFVKKKFDKNDYAWKHTMKSSFGNIILDVLLKSNFQSDLIPPHSPYHKALSLIIMGMRHNPLDAQSIYNEIIYYNKYVQINKNVI